MTNEGIRKQEPPISVRSSGWRREVLEAHAKKHGTGLSGLFSEVMRRYADKLVDDDFQARVLGVEMAIEEIAKQMTTESEKEQ